MYTIFEEKITVKMLYSAADMNEMSDHRHAALYKSMKSYIKKNKDSE
jgi:hypothetical protein